MCKKLIMLVAMLSCSIALMVVAACGPSYVHLDNTYFRCNLDNTENPQNRSFGAMLMSLKTRGWVIDNIDFKRKKIVAGACLLTGAANNCVTLIFSVMPNGSIVAKSPRQAPCRDNLQDDFVRWNKLLNSEWSKYRCYTDEAIKAELLKYGFKY